jgi:hypothetical protein
MPIIPPNSTPYDTANSILNVARMRTNDLIVNAPNSPSQDPDIGLQYTQIGGSTLLDENEPRTQIIFNAAWRRLQKRLGNLGYRRLIGDNLTIYSLPVNSSPDPADQSNLTWSGFFDGQYFWDTPQLPQDFCAPLKVRERISGTNSPFMPMMCGLDGLTSWYIRNSLNRMWEWRDDALYLLGATGLTDLNLRYIKYLPDIVDSGELPWYYIPVPIMRCSDALAWYIAVEVTSARGPEFVADLEAKAELAMSEIFNDQARADQRTNCRRLSRSGRGGRGYGGI